MLDSVGIESGVGVSSGCGSSDATISVCSICTMLAMVGCAGTSEGSVVAVGMGFGMGTEDESASVGVGFIDSGAPCASRTNSCSSGGMSGSSTVSISSVPVAFLSAWYY